MATFAIVLAALCALADEGRGDESAAADIRAGAAAVDITPPSLPAIVSGGFLSRQAAQVHDRLHSRALVLDDGRLRIALVVVDNLMMRHELLDAIKADASDRTGIPAERMMISATHTHSAPSVMGALGTPVDEAYAKFLPERVVASIVEANERLEPARVGSAIAKAFEHNHCRRWVLRPDRMQSDPFGVVSVRAMMHPGHESANHIGPAGPADPDLSLLAVQARDGRPIAVLANYAMHYKGAPAVSADVCGRFGAAFARQIGAADLDPPFVGMLSQGTSGDSMWMDYAKPRRDPGLDGYAEALAAVAKSAYEAIEFRSDASLAMAESRLRLRRRTPDAERLQKYRTTAALIGERLPRSRPEVYALEAVHLADEPIVEVPLQAVRVGDLGVATLPNEVYGLTGLKIKAQSPLAMTCNIELANGASGYIPPPEQHALGGYTTWPARTAGLEVEAEPKIVAELLRLLEKVSGRPRVRREVPEDDYLAAVRSSRPRALWRLDEMAGDVARDASGNSLDGTYEPGVAFWLPGRGPAGLVDAERIAARAVHLAGGRVRVELDDVAARYSVEAWIFNGLPSDVREVTGHVFALGDPSGRGADRLAIGGIDTHGTLEFAGGDGATLIGTTPLRRHAWHHVVAVRDGRRVAVYLNGAVDPEIAGELAHRLPAKSELVLGGAHDASAGLEGKLDDAAFWNRPLEPHEIATHYRASGLEPPRPPPLPKAAAVYRDRPSSPQDVSRFARAIRASKPLAYWTLHTADGARVPDASGHGHDARLEKGARTRKPGDDSANFDGGRVVADVGELGVSWSVELWIWNDLAVTARPVTGYFFSRGPGGTDSAAAPGEHIGIGGTHSAGGRLIVFNGNARDELLAGHTALPVGSWHHVVLTRDGRRVRVYLNGDPEPDIDGDLVPTFAPSEGEVFIGGRNDRFAPFQGRIDQVAVWNRSLTAAEAKAQFDASGVQPAAEDSRGSKSPARPRSPPPPIPPRSPEESAALLHVRDGYTAELVLAEPLVRDPVAIDWGNDGALWVVEMADYPDGMDDKGLPGGRVRRVEDTDGDGRYDRSTVFLDGVSFPTGVLPWKDGVLVTAAPELFYAEDVDGDGRADRRRPIFAGFFEGNEQLRVNGLRWGLDNLVYCASGGHHAGFGATNVVRVIKSGEAIALGSRDFRFDPDAGTLDPQSGPSQYGRVRDDWGDWYGLQNSYPIWHWVLADHYVRRNPHFAAPDARRQLRLPGNPRVFTAKAPQKRFHSFNESGRFTSACSPMVYRDELLFPRGEWHGEWHAFTCEPFHNLVQRHVITADGVSFRGRRADDGDVDFFASRDRWCRPVMVRTGPDGALWVVDMYRYVIEHPDWLPQNAREELRPFFTLGRDRGRIYRVVPKGRPPREVPRVASLDARALVRHLETPSGTLRDRVQMTIVSRRMHDAAPDLEKLAVASKSPRARLAALCTLDGLGALSDDGVLSALDDDHPGVRRQAVRLAESRARRSMPLRNALVGLADTETDAKVRLQLACTLGEVSGARAGHALARLLARATTGADRDGFLEAAAMSSVNAQNIEAIVTAVSGDALPRLLGVALALERADVVEHTVARLAASDETNLTVERCRVLGAALAALARDEKGRGVIARCAALEPTIAHARELVETDGAPRELRAAAVDLLGHRQQDRGTDVELLAGLLSPRTPDSVQSAVVDRLARDGGGDVPARLLASWTTQVPTLRKHVVAALVGRDAWAKALLDEIESGRVLATDVDAATKQQLAGHRDQQTRKRAAELLVARVDPDRDRVFSAYAPALEKTPRTASGEALFRERCATCHRLREIGHEVGAHLASITDRRPQSLLRAIVDPGQAVDPRFVGYSAVRVDGTVVTGVIAAETATSLTLLSGDGRREVIARNRILELRSTNASLMPIGLEEGLRPEQMAELVHWVAAALEEESKGAAGG